MVGGAGDGSEIAGRSSSSSIPVGGDLDSKSTVDLGVELGKESSNPRLSPDDSSRVDVDLEQRTDVVIEIGKASIGQRALEAPGLEAEKGACTVLDVRCGGGKGSKGDGGGEETEKVCRICHLSSDTEWPDGSELIQLGCGCKGELGTAHWHCGEAWFKLRGNRYCEICGGCAKNITGVEDISFMEEWNERRMLANFSSGNSSERSRCWRGQPFCNFLMGCLVIAFILPWFFRVNMF